MIGESRLFRNVPVGIDGDSGINGAINGGKIICQPLSMLALPFTSVSHYRELRKKGKKENLESRNDFDSRSKTVVTWPDVNGFQTNCVGLVPPPCPLVTPLLDGDSRSEWLAAAVSSFSESLTTVFADFLRVPNSVIIKVLSSYHACAEGCLKWDNKNIWNRLLVLLSLYRIVEISCNYFILFYLLYIKNLVCLFHTIPSIAY